MDIKAPGSDMDKYMFYDNISKLDEKDNLKFVVTSKDDMFWSKEVIEKYKPKCRIYFSPCIGYGDITLKDVAEFIIKNKISKNIRYSLQIHKIIWTPETRGV
jgi:7-carboxy-7-deazaguanine synthase